MPGWLCEKGAAIEDLSALVGRGHMRFGKETCKDMRERESRGLVLQGRTQSDFVSSQPPMCLFCMCGCVPMAPVVGLSVMMLLLSCIEQPPLCLFCMCGCVHMCAQM